MLGDVNSLEKYKFNLFFWDKYDCLTAHICKGQRGEEGRGFWYKNSAVIYHTRDFETSIDTHP